MGRHHLARSRRKSRVVPVLFIASVAVFFAVGADVHQRAAIRDAQVKTEVVAVADESIGGIEIVPAAPVAFALPPGGEAAMVSGARPLAAASRWRVDNRPRLLPVGIAPERGLQIRTILASRSISAAFPEITSIGGVRPDALPWHPNGLALDVTIPNPGTAQGIALGNEIVAFVLKNAVRFGMQDAIWRGVYYTPYGPQGSSYGHFDHVHITTTGGGYPAGDEQYYR